MMVLQFAFSSVSKSLEKSSDICDPATFFHILIHLTMWLILYIPSLKKANGCTILEKRLSHCNSNSDLKSWLMNLLDCAIKVGSNWEFDCPLSLKNQSAKNQILIEFSSISIRAIIKVLTLTLKLKINFSVTISVN